jgi:hypothetical protein
MAALTFSEIKTESFRIDLHKQDQDILAVSLHGSADKAVFKKLEVFLAEVHEHVRTLLVKEVVFDVQELFFVDSSSLSLFLRLDNLVVQLRPRHRCMLRFRLNPRLSWQKKSFSALSATSMGTIIIE